MSTERLTAHAFHAEPGTQDWRVLFGGAHAHFRTAGLQQAAELVARIADIAADLGLAPDLDVRPEGVTVRTCSRADGALAAGDAELARRVSRAAHDLGLEPDPAQVQAVWIAVAQDAGADVRPFWNAVLGYRDLGDEDSADPARRHPGLWFHQLRPPRPGRGRVHIDISVPADQIEARVAAAVAAGGRVVDDSQAPRTWTLASPENHGVDLAAWPDVEDDDE